MESSPHTYTLTIALSEGTQLNHTHLHWINDVLVLDIYNEDYQRYGMGILAMDKVDDIKIKKIKV